jgi:hypothetical protein
MGLNSWLTKSLALYSAYGLKFMLKILIIPIVVHFIGFQGYGFYSVHIILTSTLLFLDSALLLAWRIGLPLLTIMAALWTYQVNSKMRATMLVAFLLAFGSFKFMIDGPDREKLIEAETPIVNAVTTMFSAAGGEASPQKTTRAFAPGKSDSFSCLADSAKKEEAHNLEFDMPTQVAIAGVLLFAALNPWLLVKAYQARAPYSLAVKNGSFTAARKKPQPT